MLRRAAARAAAGALLLATACAGFPDGTERTITVGGDKVNVAHLRDAQAGLCEAKGVAATDPTAARADFYNQSHDSLHTVARALEPVDRGLAADLLVSMQKVEADLETKPPTLAAELGQLADVYRSGLGRLAITVTACVE
ncbi:MAG TPA: hypothetical protein VHT97_14830 [Acidimicrobiales bacterium]|nr:hypothetical protein [Acidimicrobiales bacterium]